MAYAILNQLVGVDDHVVFFEVILKIIESHEENAVAGISREFDLLFKSLGPFGILHVPWARVNLVGIYPRTSHLDELLNLFAVFLEVDYGQNGVGVALYETVFRLDTDSRHHRLLLGPSRYG